MRRMASLFTLSAWTGFLGVCAGRVALSNMGGGPEPDHLAASLASDSLLMDPTSAFLFVTFLAALALSLAAGMLCLSSHEPLRVRQGEGLASAGLVATFIFFTAAGFSGAPIASLSGGGAGFTFAIAVTFAALVFDHMMLAEDKQGDEAFEAVMRALDEDETSARLRAFERRHSDRENYR